MVMPDLLVSLLSKRGPSLSTELARQFAKAGMTPAAARKRISRLSPGVKRLAFLPFPRNARFLYLERDFGSPRYWDALIAALLDTKSAYGLALAALKQRGGIIPLKHFPIACGAPLRQKRHLSPETILQRLKKAQLIGEYPILGVGACVALIQGPDRYDDGKVEIRARLLVERMLLTAIADWLKRLGIVSFGRVALRDSATAQPTVGTFAWDLSAPSYLGGMAQRVANGKSKPGFVACDVLSGIQVSEEGLKPFLNKCATLRSLKRIGPCLQMFVADHFAPAAFELAKRTGIIPATPSNLFGKDVGEGLLKLFDVLRDAANFGIEPEAFNLVFEKLSRIEGVAISLRGILFEYLVAEIVRRQSPSHLVRVGKIFKVADGAKVEVDVVGEVPDVSVRFIECKGYQPAGTVSDEYVTRWVTRTIPRLYDYARSHPDWRSLKVHFELWTTGKLSESGVNLLSKASANVRPTRYTIALVDPEAIRTAAKSLQDGALLKVFNDHFFEHPLASAERELQYLYVRRARSLATTELAQEPQVAISDSEELIAPDSSGEPPY